MLKNMGSADRIIRFLIAVLILILYLADQITGTAAVLLGILAIVFLATSFMGFCPAYYPFKLKTTKKAG